MTPLICFVGPTASGKSALALEVCARIGGEILACDSMQIYRGCDIATAKPARAEQETTPHHLLDLCEPNERFSAAQWVKNAKIAIASIEKRGKKPVICGGTGFWLRALLLPDFLSDVAPDAALKAQLEAQLEAQGAAQMHAQLEQIDPDAARRLHSNDTFRVLRALEIALLRPQTEAPEIAPQIEFEAQIFGLNWPRQQLYERIDSRVAAMIAAGALEELRVLREKWGDDAPALGGVGYKQMLPVLRGEIALEEGVEGWKRDSRRYAKRQMTWFRHQLPLRWLDATRNVDELADEALSAS
jgi:tRNA dimethylallyltransferase